MNTDLLRLELAKRIVTVTFKKINGDIRIMECTINPAFIPPAKHPKGELELSEESKQKTFRVFDVKAQGWRSFQSDSVIEAV